MSLFATGLRKAAAVSDHGLLGAIVTDWDGIRSALAKRGHGVGAMHHLPEFTDEEVGRW